MSSISEDVPIEKKFDDLCNELKIDNAIQEEAWEKYKDVWNSYSLDGDHLQWLVCALYECFQKPQTNPELYGGLNENDFSLNSLQVSLHKLIHSAGMTYVQFFYRIKKWSEMVEMSDALRDRIEILERQFAVACVLYSKYSSVFLTLFQRIEFSFLNISSDPTFVPGTEKDADEPEVEELVSTDSKKPGTPANKRNAKKAAVGTPGRKAGSSGAAASSKKTCSVQDLYKFTWLLFVQVRSNFPAVCDDLVNSYHLLLCVIEFVYSNAISAHRKDLLNSSFPATATLMQSTSMSGSGNTRTVAAVKEERTELALRLLCDIHGCQFVHCKSLTDFHVRPYLRRLIEKDYLKGRHLTLTGILDATNFYASNRLLNTIYEDWIRCTGAFDERLLFLSDAELRSIIGSGKDHLRISNVPPAAILTSHQTPLAKRYMNKRASLFHVCTTVSTDSPVKGKSGKEILALGDSEDVSKHVPLIFTQHDKLTANIMQRYCISVHLNTQEERNHCLHQLHQILSQNLNMSAITDDPTADMISETLRNLFTTHCPNTTSSEGAEEVNIMSYIQQRVQSSVTVFCDQFVKEYVFSKQQEERNPTTTMMTANVKRDQHESVLSQQALEAAVQRVALVQTLYYLFLERIVSEEVSKLDVSTADRINENQAVLRRFLTRDVFHKSLFSLSVEIVLRLCNPIHEYPFPWSLHCYELSAYHLYKLLGLLCYLMQAEFPRELILYLNALSEHIMDSLAWRRDSPLWHSLHRKEMAQSTEENEIVYAVPRIVDVMPLDMFEKPKPSLSRRTVIETDAASGHQITFSLGESPMKATSMTAPSSTGKSEPGTTGGGSSGSGGTSATTTSVRIQNVSTGGRATGVGGSSSTSGSTSSTQIFQIIRPPGAASGSSVSGNASNAAPVSKSHSGLTLTLQPLDVFFRHLYYVASCRLRDLCERLAVNKDVLAKTWTCLETALREQTHLMRDRHLDSLILCCLFGINSSSSNKVLSFLDIIQAYRVQPHSQRDVYRTVLLDSAESNESFATDTYGDLIQFYNHMFLPLLTNHLKQFAGLSGLHSAMMRHPMNTTHLPYTLSPVPVKQSEIKINSRSVRRLLAGRNVYVSPVKNQMQMSPKRIVFCMQQSPSKELREINSMLYHHERKSHLNNSMNVGIKRVHPSILHGITTHFNQSSSNYAPTLSRFDSSSSFPKRLHFDN